MAGHLQTQFQQIAASRRGPVSTTTSGGGNTDLPVLTLQTSMVRTNLWIPIWSEGEELLRVTARQVGDRTNALFLPEKLVSKRGISLVWMPPHTAPIQSLQCKRTVQYFHELERRAADQTTILAMRVGRMPHMRFIRGTRISGDGT